MWPWCGPAAARVRRFLVALSTATWPSLLVPVAARVTQLLVRLVRLSVDGVALVWPWCGPGVALVWAVVRLVRRVPRSLVWDFCQGRPEKGPLLNLRGPLATSRAPFSRFSTSGEERGVYRTTPAAHRLPWGSRLLVGWYHHRSYCKCSRRTCVLGEPCSSTPSPPGVAIHGPARSHVRGRQQ